MLTYKEDRSSNRRHEIDAALDRICRRLTSRRRLWVVEAALVTAGLAATATSLIASPGVATCLAAGCGAFLLILTMARRLAAARVTHHAAARWIEQRVDLKQRLLTLVTLDGAARSRLWEELVTDNLAHLPRWRSLGSDSGLEPVGASLATAALVVAAASLGL